MIVMTECDISYDCENNGFLCDNCEHNANNICEDYYEPKERDE